MFLPTDITLQAGDSGDYVRELQRRLAQRDLLAEASVNGFFDGVTTQAVMEFQALNGLRNDGIAGPETLRRLISIGGNAGESGSGSGSGSEEEDKEKYGRDAERFDTFAAAQQLEAEQDKLANEAVWGYGGEEVAAATSQQQQGQQQLSDLNRYNQQHDQTQTRAAEAMHQQVAIEQQMQQERAPVAESQKQLEVNQQGMKAQTLAQDLQQPPEAQKDQQTKEAPKPEKAAEAKTESPERQAQPEVQRASVQSTDPARTADTPRDPVIDRTEAKLDAPSRAESTKEGRKLEARGVRDNGKVPESELGDLSPARSPSKQREQEIGR